MSRIFKLHQRQSLLHEKKNIKGELFMSYTQKMPVQTLFQSTPSKINPIRVWDFLTGLKAIFRFKQFQLDFKWSTINIRQFLPQWHQLLSLVDYFVFFFLIFSAVVLLWQAGKFIYNIIVFAVIYFHQFTIYKCRNWFRQ